MVQGRQVFVLSAFRALLVADVEILPVDVFEAHAAAVIGDLDGLVVDVEVDIDAGRVSIPRVCNDLGNDSWRVAVEVEPHVV